MKELVKRFIVTDLCFFLLALLLPALTGFALRSDSAPGLRDDQQTNAQTKKSSTSVNDLFRNNCARCHGADGRGDTPLGHTYKTPDFTDAEWWRKHANITSTGSLISIVTRGKGGMPAFGKKLTRSQIRLLVSHVRKFKP